MGGGQLHLAHRGQDLETLTFAILVRRQNIRQCKPDVRLWTAVRKELLQASSLLPLMSTSLDLPWCSLWLWILSAQPLALMNLNIRVRTHADFSEVHPSVLEFEKWRSVFSGEWQCKENILSTEGRAMISVVRHKRRCRRCLLITG